MNCCHEVTPAKATTMRGIQELTKRCEERKPDLTVCLRIGKKTPSRCLGLLIFSRTLPNTAATHRSDSSLTWQVASVTNHGKERFTGGTRTFQSSMFHHQNHVVSTGAKRTRVCAGLPGNLSQDQRPIIHSHAHRVSLEVLKSSSSTRLEIRIC